MPIIVNILDRVFTRTVAFLCVALFVIMVASVFGQVVMRYAFSSPLSWSEELARYAMVWQAMLAAALCARKGQHLALIQTEAFPARIRGMLRITVTISACLLLAVLLWASYDLASRATRQTTPGLGLSMSYIYASLPVGFSLMIVGQILGALAGPNVVLETQKIPIRIPTGSAEIDRGQ